MVQLEIYSIGLDNGLAPNRREAIDWTNNLLTHICVFRSQWVRILNSYAWLTTFIQIRYFLKETWLDKYKQQYVENS